jgi:hypothetical protein
LLSWWRCCLQCVSAHRHRRFFYCAPTLADTSFYLRCIVCVNQSRIDW